VTRLQSLREIIRLQSDILQTLNHQELLRDEFVLASQITAERNPKSVDFGYERDVADLARDWSDRWRILP
jgi:hypothetical protein